MVDTFAAEVLPGWVQELTVRWSDDRDVNAQIFDDYHYRRVQIDLGASFFSQSRLERSRDFVHELAHALQSPMTAFVSIAMPKGRGREGEALKALYVEAMEASCQDIADALWRRLKSLDSP